MASERIRRGRRPGSPSRAADQWLTRWEAKEQEVEVQAAKEHLELEAEVWEEEKALEVEMEAV